MPRRQPRWPSIGFASRSESIFASLASSAALRAGLMPSASRRARGPRGVFRRVGIGPHAELAIAVGPREKLLRRSADLRRGALDRVEDHLTRLTIDRDDVALAHHAPTGLEHAALLVDDDIVGADDARFAHADRDHRRV